MVFQLPMFNGFTVDARLREFRSVVPGRAFRSIPFDCIEGQQLLLEMKEYFSFLNDY